MSTEISEVKESETVMKQSITNSREKIKSDVEQSIKVQPYTLKQEVEHTLPVINRERRRR